MTKYIITEYYDLNGCVYYEPKRVENYWLFFTDEYSISTNRKQSLHDAKQSIEKHKLSLTPPKKVYEELA